MESKSRLSFSPLLKEAIELRIDELSRKKDKSNEKYQSGIAALEKAEPIERVKYLMEHITRLDFELEKDNDLEIMARYIKHASIGHTLSESKVCKLEKQLRKKAWEYLSRLEISALYCRLLKEASLAEDATTSTVKPDSVDLEDEFEVIEQELDKVLEKSERENSPLKILTLQN